MVLGFVGIHRVVGTMSLGNLGIKVTNIFEQDFTPLY